MREIIEGIEKRLEEDEKKQAMATLKHMGFKADAAGKVVAAFMKNFDRKKFGAYAAKNLAAVEKSVKKFLGWDEVWERLWEIYESQDGDDGEQVDE